MGQKIFSILIFLLLTVLAACNSSQPQGLVVEDAWVRAGPPGAHMLAGYGVIKNHGGQEKTLESLESPDFRDVSLHETRLQDGISSMREVQDLALAPEEQLSMVPGGHHLMLMGPQKELKEGDTVTIILHFSDGESITITPTLERR